MESMTKLMKHIKRELGIMGWSLPLEDNDIIDIIYEEVLRPFSVYYPREIPVNVNVSDLKYTTHNCVHTFDLDFILPKDAELIAISKLNNTNINFANMGNMYMYQNYNMMDMISAQVTDNMNSTIDIPSPTFKFIPPNKIEFYNLNNLYSNTIEVVLFITHTALETLPITVISFFRKLAVAVVQKYLYKILQRIDKIDTIYGTIDLRIDNWAEAEQKVNELMETLETEQILFSQHDKVYYTR